MTQKAPKHSRLRQAGRRWLLGLTGTLRLSYERREPILVRPRRGSWVHRYRGGSLVLPGIGGPSLRHFRSVALDTFCYRYTPHRGDIVVDIGAGIGEEAIVFSPLVGRSGRIVCIEAHPRTFELLVATTEVNRLANVEKENLAITDHSGQTQISDEAPERYSLNTLLRKRSLTVAADTLDGLYDRLALDHVDFLKMNIEGAEGLAIASWSKALARTRQLAISCHDFIHLANPDTPPALATFDSVKGAVEAAGFEVDTRPDDQKPWNRYYVYGTNR